MKLREAFMDWLVAGFQFAAATVDLFLIGFSTIKGGIGSRVGKLFIRSS